MSRTDYSALRIHRIHSIYLWSEEVHRNNIWFEVSGYLINILQQIIHSIEFPISRKHSLTWFWRRNILFRTQITFISASQPHMTSVINNLQELQTLNFLTTVIVKIIIYHIVSIVPSPSDFFLIILNLSSALCSTLGTCASYYFYNTC